MISSNTNIFKPKAYHFYDIKNIPIKLFRQNLRAIELEKRRKIFLK